MKPYCRLIAFILAMIFAGQLHAQTYCTPSFGSGVAPITYVKLNNISKSSSALLSSAAYENFTTDTFWAGPSQNMTLTIMGNTDGNNTDVVTAYFDWNQNGVFTDPGEAYPVGTITNSLGNNLLQAAITGFQVPGAVTGYTRLRVAKQRGSQASSCVNGGVGQAEDYTIYFGIPPCSGLPNAGVTNLDTFLCAGSPLALQVINYSQASAQFIQWESATVQGNFTAIFGATNDTYIMPGATVPTWFRAVFSCANASGVAIAGPFLVNTSLAKATADTMLCVGGTINVTGTNCTGCTIALSGPNGFTTTSLNFNIPNATVNNDGWYRYNVNGPSCNSHDSFYVHVVACPDSVWPGDANHDYIVNYLDILPIAQHYGSTGYVRPFATNNYVGQACPDWPTANPASVNLKHADCDGNGTIAIADTTAVSLHYNLTHPRGVYTPQPKISGLPDVYLDVSAVNFYPGTTVNIPIVMGSTAIPFPYFLGIATEIKMTGLQMTQPPAINLAINPASSINFVKMANTSQVDWTWARDNHVGYMGGGVFAYLNLYIPPGTEGDSVLLYFDNTSVIDPSGNILTGYNLLPSTIVVKDPTGIAGTNSFATNAVVIPNPSKEARILLTLDEAASLTITVSDVTGRIVTHTEHNMNAGTHQLQLPDNIAPGMYNVQLTDKKTSAKKLLKWIKE